MDIRLAVDLECRKRAADGVRSRDLVLTKHTLYQAELRRHSMGNVYRLIKTFKKVILEFLQTEEKPMKMSKAVQPDYISHENVLNVQYYDIFMDKTPIGFCNTLLQCEPKN